LVHAAEKWQRPSPDRFFASCLAIQSILHIASSACSIPPRATQLSNCRSPHSCDSASHRFLQMRGVEAAQGHELAGRHQLTGGPAARINIGKAS
jgi:hypothetical protein